MKGELTPRQKQLMEGGDGRKVVTVVTGKQREKGRGRHKNAFFLPGRGPVSASHQATPPKGAFGHELILECRALCAP